MELIDWAGVARNALWILGLSTALAALSHASWLAGRRGMRQREIFGWPAFQAAFSAGCVLFAAGLAWSATQVWERVAWVALLAAFAWQFLSAARAARAAGRADSQGE
jgi:hypothetical protein